MIRKKSGAPADSPSLTSMSTAELAALEMELVNEIDPDVFAEVFHLLDNNDQQTLKIEKYEIQKLLGKSGQAVVFVARDPDLGRLVVIKLFHSKICESDLELLLREGRALSRIKSERVVTCYSAEQFGECPFLVLEYLPYPTLSEFVTEKKTLEQSETLQILKNICLGLKEVHQAGLIHGDIKPSNILVRKYRGSIDVSLIDFGLSHRSGDFETDPRGGTPSYMSPECANNYPVGTDFRSDVFGVGAVAFCLLTGEAPYNGNSRDELIASAKQCRPNFEILENSGFQDALVDFVKTAMSKDPADRFQDIDSCYAALMQIEKSSRRKKLILSATVMVLIVSLAGLIWQFGIAPNRVASPSVESMDEDKAPYELLFKTQMGRGTPRSDFAISAWIDGEKISLRKVRPIRLEVGEPVIRIETEIDCYVVVLSLNRDAKHPNKTNMLTVYSSEVSTAETEPKKVRTFSPELSPSISTEYMLVLASNRPWNPTEFCTAFNLHPDKSKVPAFWTFKSGFRDMKPSANQLKVSECLIPFNVEAAEDQTSSLVETDR